MDNHVPRVWKPEPRAKRIDYLGSRQGEISIVSPEFQRPKECEMIA